MQTLHHMVEDLENTSSSTEKLSILKGYLDETPDLRHYLDMVYNPFIQYYLTSSIAIKKGKREGLFDSECTDFMLHNTLEALSSRQLSGQNAYNVWLRVLEDMPKQYRYLANRILDKDLKCRTGLKMVNKALVSLRLPEIPTHEVSLGYQWKGEPVWEDGIWCMSRKLDGVRCNVILKEGTVQLLSRQGKPFDTLGALEEIFKDYEGPDCILDGELALSNKEGKDDFTGLMKEIRRKDHQIENVVFYCFDYLPFKGLGLLNFKSRYHGVKMMASVLDSKRFLPVKQIRIRDEEHFLSMKLKAEQRGWEGLMLRKNAPYKQGRSRDLYKVKSMQDLEAVVVGTESGDMNIVENGREKSVKVMTKAIIKHKGCEVGVGSGWSIEERRAFYGKPWKIIGKTITVQYFEETRNQKGGYGLRFPVKKAIHGMERDT